MNSEKIDVYVFVPNEQGWNKWIMFIIILEILAFILLI